VPEPDVATRLDDAFDRYETFRGHHQNRLSVASVETNLASPTAASPSTMTTSSSGGSEGRGYSHLLHFLGRKTPSEADRRPTISGPILQTPENGGSSRSNSPAFGSVCYPPPFAFVLLNRGVAVLGEFGGQVRARRHTYPRAAAARGEWNCVLISYDNLRCVKAIFELITTEVAYVRDLQLIVEVRGSKRKGLRAYVAVDFLLEYDAASGAQGNHSRLCEY
jgi:hypothetical protein